MRAIQIQKPGSYGLVELPTPTPGPEDVIVAVGACGICGTDLHILAGEFAPTPYPIVPGHEAAGTVSAVGSKVLGIREGDRVAIDPSLFCGSCDFCRVGRGNLCERWGAIGDTVDGAFAEFVKAPSANAYPIADSMGFGEAALVEPVSCAVHAVDRLQLRFGETVLIYGAGTMGLILAQLLRFAGASLVALCDVNPLRLERARMFGFSVVGADFEAVRPAAPRGFGNVIDATGVTRVVEIAMGAVAKGGKLMVFGVTPAGERAAFETFRIYNEEITIVGSMAVLHSYGRAVDIVAAGGVDAPKMLTHTFGLDGFAEALETVRRGSGLKVQVRPTV
jgi:2-desacetyl-2-hydroxyethyl bacteriochlorophyllide A dehydrogenase